MVYWIDDPNGAATPPAPPADTGLHNFFQEEDAANGIPKTYLRAWFLNMVAQELLAAVQLAGITPSKTQNNQLILAIIQAVVQGFGLARSDGTTGYNVHPGGMIEQWGIGGSGSQGNSSVTFPIAFPTACRTVVLTEAHAIPQWTGDGTHGAPTLHGVANGASQTGFSAYSMGWSVSSSQWGGAANIAYFWRAIGR